MSDEHLLSLFPRLAHPLFPSLSPPPRQVSDDVIMTSLSHVELLYLSTNGVEFNDISLQCNTSWFVSPPPLYS